MDGGEDVPLKIFTGSGGLEFCGGVFCSFSESEIQSNTGAEGAADVDVRFFFRIESSSPLALLSRTTGAALFAFTTIGSGRAG